MCLFMKVVGGRNTRGKITPEDIKLNTSGFDNNLDVSIADVQKLADKVDELELDTMPEAVANRLMFGKPSASMPYAPEWTATKQMSYSENVFGIGGYTLSSATASETQYYGSVDVRVDGAENGQAMGAVHADSYYNGNICTSVRVVSANSYGSGNWNGSEAIISFYAASENENEDGRYLTIGIDRHRDKVLDTSGFDIKIDGTYRADVYAGSGDSAAYWDAAGTLRRDGKYPLYDRIDYESAAVSNEIGTMEISAAELGLGGLDLFKAIKRLDTYRIRAGEQAAELMYDTVVRIEQLRIILSGYFAVGDRVRILGEYHNYLNT